MTSAEPNTVLTKARKEDYLRVEHCQAFRGEWRAWSFTLDGRISFYPKACGFYTSRSDQWKLLEMIAL